MSDRPGHPEDWSPYLDGEVSDERYSGLREHLEGCESCRKYVSGAERLDSLFRSPELEIEVPPFQWTRIQAAIESLQVPRKRSLFEFLRIPRTVWATGLASLALFGAVVGRVTYRQIADARRLAEVTRYSEKMRAETAENANPFSAYLQQEPANPFSQFQVAGEENPFTMKQ
jgi:anti-sigma factor RsiW